MSWSLQFIGKKDNIVAALKEKSNELNGQSKIEFDEALPHMIGLLDMNTNAAANGSILKLTANGHAYNGYGQCYVNIEPVATSLV